MSAAPLRQPRPVTRTAPQVPTRAGARGGAQRATTPRPRSMPQSAPRRRDHLRPVAAPEQVRSMVPFAWVCVAIVLAAMASVLLLNTTMASGAYERRDLKIEIADLHQQRATLVTQLESNSSPQFLANMATDMGMVPAKTLGFISLSDDLVIQSKGKK